MLTEACLPALLAPGNLPALASRFPIRIAIYAKSADMANVVESTVFSRLKALGEIDFVSIDEVDVSNHLAAHAKFWHMEMDRAQGTDVVAFIQRADVLADVR